MSYFYDFTDKEIIFYLFLRDKSMTNCFWLQSENYITWYEINFSKEYQSEMVLKLSKKNTVYTLIFYGGKDL